MLGIDILFILTVKGCMFITYVIENSEECLVAKFHTNLGMLTGLRKHDYWCWLVIRIILLHRLFIQILTQMGFSTHLTTKTLS